MTDMVNHPTHYANAEHGITGECIQYAEHLDMRRGTAFRYLWRAGFKWNAVEDLEKAAWYIGRDIARGNGVVTDKPGHLTNLLHTSPSTLRRDLLIDLWERHSLTRTHNALTAALTDPATLDTPRSHQ